MSECVCCLYACLFLLLYCCGHVRLFRCFVFVSVLYFGMCVKLCVYVCIFVVMLFVFICLLIVVFVCVVFVRFLNV